LSDVMPMWLLMIVTGGAMLILAGILRLDKNIYIKGQEN